MNEENKIVFDPPDPDMPGFLRRLENAAKFQVFIETKHLTADTAKDMANFLADFVVEPTDREEVIKLLFDASENDFMAMLNAVSGGTADVPPEKGGS